MASILLPAHLSSFALRVKDEGEVVLIVPISSRPSDSFFNPQTLNGVFRSDCVDFKSSEPAQGSTLPHFKVVVF